MERTVIDIDKDHIVVPFDWFDPTPGGRNLGRAEFVVCMKFKRGKVSEYWVDPKQTRIEHIWHYMGGTSFGDFSVSAYEQLEDPKVWMFNWCSMHKTIAVAVYAPKDSKYLVIGRYGLEFYRTNPYPQED